MTKELESIGFENNENDKYGHLTLVDIPAEVAAHGPWFNQTLTTVNDAVVRIGIFKGEFPWHKHDDQDEFFLVLDGEMYLDTEQTGSILLRRNQGFTVPRQRCIAHARRKPPSCSWSSGSASFQREIERGPAVYGSATYSKFERNRLRT